MKETQFGRVAIVSRCARTLFTFRLSLIKSLRERGVTVDAYGASGEGFENRLLECGIRFCDVPVSFKGVAPWRDLRLFLALIRQFRETKPSLVHSFTIKPAIYATLAAAVARVPARVVTITGLGYAFVSAGGLLSFIVQRLYKLALAQAHVVFFQNAADRELFISLGLVKRSQAELVPGSGVDTEYFSEAPLPKSLSGTVTFLMISRWLKEKGVREFFRAAQIVRSQFPGTVFKLLGGPDSRNPTSLNAGEVNALAAVSGVELHGEVLDVRPHIAAADVVVLPSYREGLPRVLLEAGSMGRALIASDVPGCQHVIVHGQTGLLVRAQDADALADAMRLVMTTQGAVERFGQAARQRATQCFDERIVIGKTLEMYARLTD